MHLDAKSKPPDLSPAAAPPSAPPLPPAPSPPATVTPVEYERPSNTAVVRALRLLLLVTVVNTMLLGLNFAGSRPWDFVRRAYNDWSTKRAAAQATALREKQLLAAQSACVGYAFEPGYLAYTEVPDEAMTLMADGKRYTGVMRGETPPTGWQTPALAAGPDCLQQFNQVLMGTPRTSSSRSTMALMTGTAFLHERRSPHGSAALVITSVSAGHEVDSQNQVLADGQTLRRTYSVKKTRSLLAVAHPAPLPAAWSSDYQRLMRRYELRLVLPDNDMREAAQIEVSQFGGQSLPDPPTSQPLVIAPGHRLRVLGGQPDPADASHWTIPYELDGRPGTIDGWLKDDAILLRPREGRMIPSAGTPQWELLPAQPTTPP